MKRFVFRLSLAGLALAALAPVASAQWVWRDANRQVHASDRPPPASVPDKDILSRPPGAAAKAAPAPAAAEEPAAAASAPAEGKPKIDPALEAKRRAVEQDKRASEAESQQKAEAARKDNCSRARTYQQSLDSGQRISRTNAQGEREFLDDAARAQEVQRTRDIIARDCR